MKKLSLLLIISFVLVSCKPSEDQIQKAIKETNVAAAEITENAATNTPLPQPTDTKQPTRTIGPTNTFAPTVTPKPTRTPTLEPTKTPVPEPIQLKGTGDSVVDFDNPFGRAFAHIENNSGRFFAVKNLDASNESIDLLVNTTDVYDGYVPIDFKDGELTKRFEVNATGDWTITIYPLATEYTRKCTIPGTCSGIGNDVIVLDGGKPDVLKIKYEGTRYFIVITYNNSDWDLLVNQVGAYDGTVLVKEGMNIIEIKTEGEWTIEVLTR